MDDKSKAKIGDFMKIEKEILKTAKKEIFYNILTSVSIRAIILVLPLFWAEVISNITNNLFEKAYLYVLFCLIAVVLYWLSEYLNQHAYYKLYNKIYSNLTCKAIGGINKNSLFSLSRFSLSEYLNILNSDIDIISAFYSNLIPRAVRIIEMLVIYYYFYRVNFYMFLIVVFISLIGFLLFYLARKKTEKNNSDRKMNLDIKTNYNHEFFSGIRDIKSFNLFEKITTRLFDGTDNYLKSNAKYHISFNSDKFFIVCIIEIVKYLLMFYGVYLIGIDYMDIGVLVIIYNYYAKIVDNFSIVSTLNVERCNLIVSKKRYNKIFEFANNNEDAIIKKRNFVGKIEFKNILYGYKNDPILDSVSFVIKENSITSLIGRDDSGNHGVYELLLKMNRQHTGTITIDDIDIKDIQNNTYYNIVSLVSPNPFFFNLSIKENLMIINKNFDEIVALCKELNIHNVIKALPNGYDTIINDNITTELKYMLAIARVFLKKTKIILIADVLFELDKNDFDIVVNYLKKISENHTIIVMGRELDLCDISDKVIVFNKNKVEEIGTHQELIIKKGFYYNNFYNYGNKKEK